MSVPLRERPHFRETLDSPLRQEVIALCRKHGLHGCVLVSFYEDRVGVTSAGSTPLLIDAMEKLGVQILTAIDDGQFDPEEPS